MKGKRSIQLLYHQTEAVMWEYKGNVQGLCYLTK